MFKNYSIYQLNEEGFDKYGFLPFKYAKKDFSINDYDNLYNGVIDTEEESDESILEKLFRKFNRVTQEDCERLEKMGFKGHSLSTSDVIELEGTLYYCDSFGWTKVEK